MRKRNDYLLRLRPWSISTFIAALLAVALATTMQEILASFGARLCFAGFSPSRDVVGVSGQLAGLVRDVVGFYGLAVSCVRVDQGDHRG